MPKELNDKLESKIELPNQNLKTPEPHIPQQIATVEIFIFLCKDLFDVIFFYKLQLNLILVLNKQEREYVPYDSVKIYIEKLVVQINSQRGSYIKTIRDLEEKYKGIEMEANGHFAAFVAQIKRAGSPLCKNKNSNV